MWNNYVCHIDVGQKCVAWHTICVTKDTVKQKGKIRHTFCWTDMAKTVEDYVDSCLACQKKARAVLFRGMKYHFLIYILT